MDDLKRMDRREAIKWMLSASAALSVLDPNLLRASGTKTGYGTDPNLMEVYKPGDLWPLTLDKEQHQTVAVLCDMLLPADEKSPSASELKVPDFIDEWISAPYPQQQADRTEILEGLKWVDSESTRRFGKPFATLGEAQKQKIGDDICSVQKPAPGCEKAARFFDKFRALAMAGFYTTPDGIKDIGYVGNVPLTRFDGPPPEVLRFLKLT